ncbi:MAG: GNAT family N-acetyltransferase [Cyanophyceae cyanobacterium]
MDIVPLEKSDFAIAANCLAAAFAQDPLISHFLPGNAEAKRLALEKMSQGLLNWAQPYKHIYTTADRPKGVAIWLPPEESDATLSQLWGLITSGLLQTPLYFRWDRLLDLVWLSCIFPQIHEKLMPEPHWYLGMLGVSPQCQGQGVGGKLIQPILELADRSKTDCYLETTTPSAVQFIEGNGFLTLHQVFFAGHPYWALKRSPHPD